MSYAAAITEELLKQPGTRVPVGNSLSSEKSGKYDQMLWNEIVRTQAIGTLPQASTTRSVSFAVETLPTAAQMITNTTASLLTVLERLFGDSATDLASMLRVSRPMVYHYWEGMEPTEKTKRRLLTLANLASGWDALAREPLKGVLRAPQPRGSTLLDLLSEEQLDVTVLRQVLWQNIQTSDHILRNRLANELRQNESVETRSDVAQERRAEGKPVYIGDPDAPGKLIQILPNGRRIKGRMVKRRFVPDEK